MTQWIVAHQAPLSMGFSRQDYWSGLPCPPPGDLPNPGIRPSDQTPVSGSAGRFFITVPLGKQLPYEAAVPPLGKPEKTVIQEDTHIPVFIAALFIITRTGKQFRCPSTDKWIKKMWYIYTMEY